MEEQIVKLYVLSTFGLIGGMGVALACLVGVGRGVGYEKGRLVESSRGDSLSSNRVVAVFMPKGVSRQANLYFKVVCVFSSSGFMASSCASANPQESWPPGSALDGWGPAPQPMASHFQKGDLLTRMHQSFVRSLFGWFVHLLLRLFFVLFVRSFFRSAVLCGIVR